MKVSIITEKIKKFFRVGKFKKSVTPVDPFDYSFGPLPPLPPRVTKTRPSESSYSTSGRETRRRFESDRYSPSIGIGFSSDSSFSSGGYDSGYSGGGGDFGGGGSDF